MSRFRNIAAVIGYDRISAGYLRPWQISDEYIDYLNFTTSPDKDDDIDDEVE